MTGFYLSVAALAAGIMTAGAFLAWILTRFRRSQPKS